MLRATTFVRQTTFPCVGNRCVDDFPARVLESTQDELYPTATAAFPPNER